MHFISNIRYDLIQHLICNIKQKNMKNTKMSMKWEQFHNKYNC